MHAVDQGVGGEVEDSEVVEGGVEQASLAGASTVPGERSPAPRSA